jgi:hypothetical protein
MLYKIFADFVVLVHFLWILLLFFGPIWGVKSKVIRIFHLSGLFFAILLQVFGWYCPLTHIEVWLRSKHDPTITYMGSFIIYYVEKVVYLELSQTTIFIFTIFLCVFNAWFY